MAHRAMIHRSFDGRVAGRAVVHAHVGHRQQRRIAQRRNLRLRTGTAYQCGDAHSRTVHRLGHDSIGVGPGGFDDHIVGLGVTDLKLVGLDRPHVLSVSSDDLHWQAGNTQVEEGHRGCVDEPQTDPFARGEGELERVLRAVAVDEIGVERRRDIGNIGRHHPHTRPHPALGASERVVVGGGRLLEIERRLAHLQLLHDRVRMHRRPVRQQYDVVAVDLVRVAIGRVDDDRPIMPHRFLQRVGMPPIGAGLPDREFVAEPFARLDRGHCHARHAVHEEWHQQPVPVDRGSHRAVVYEIDDEVLALRQPEQRPRKRTVHRHRGPATVTRGKCSVGHRHGQALARQDVASPARQGSGVIAPRPGRHRLPQADQAGRSGGSGQEFTAIERRPVGQGCDAHSPAYEMEAITPQSKSSLARSCLRAR